MRCDRRVYIPAIAHCYLTQSESHCSKLPKRVVAHLNNLHCTQREAIRPHRRHPRAAEAWTGGDIAPIQLKTRCRESALLPLSSLPDWSSIHLPILQSQRREARWEPPHRCWTRRRGCHSSPDLERASNRLGKEWRDSRDRPAIVQSAENQREKRNRPSKSQERERKWWKAQMIRWPDPRPVCCPECEECCLDWIGPDSLWRESLRTWRNIATNQKEVREERINSRGIAS